MAVQHNCAAIAPQFKPAPVGGFDATNKWAGITISGSNFIATYGGSASGLVNARSLLTKSAGKRYVEMKSAYTSGVRFTVALGSFDWTAANNSGSGTDSWNIGDSGTTRHNGAAVTHAGNAIASAEWARIAIDIDAGNLWFGDSTGWVSGDPATGSSPAYTIPTGVAYGVGITFESVGDVGTFNGGVNGSFAYTVPSGFTGWDL